MSENRLYSDYFEILSREHPTSKKHPRMSRMNRAAQFAPFAALTGYEESIEEAARFTDRKIELGEYEIEELNAKLNFIREHIKEHPEVTITYFQPDERKKGGKYVAITGRVKHIDSCYKIIIFENNKTILFDVIFILKIH